jgi:transcriptional regulator with XRE-family HTH domain
MSSKILRNSYKKAENSYMEFPERLEKLLKLKEITQTELAKRLNIRRTSISDWKRNNSFPYADVAVKMAELLGTTVEELVTGSPPAGVSPDALRLARGYDSLDAEGRGFMDIAMDGMLRTHRRGEKTALGEQIS